MESGLMNNDRDALAATGCVVIQHDGWVEFMWEREGAPVVRHGVRAQPDAAMRAAVQFWREFNAHG